MPDAAGNFKGISVPAAAWERIFGPRPTIVVCESCSSPLCARGELVCDDFLFAGLVKVDVPEGSILETEAKMADFLDGGAP